MTMSSSLIVPGMTQWMVLMWASLSVKDREEKHNTAEHSFVLASQLGWWAAGVKKPLLSAVLCFSLLSSSINEELLCRYSFNFLLPLALSSFSTHLTFCILLLLISVLSSPHLP